MQNDPFNWTDPSGFTREENDTLTKGVIATAVVTGKHASYGVIMGANAIAGFLDALSIANSINDGINGRSSTTTGADGEARVRSQNDIGDRRNFTVNGRPRRSDGLNRVLKTLSEVKNVSRIGATRQLRDYIDYAVTEKLTFHLYVRGRTATGPGTRLSKGLLKLVEEGKVVIRDIP